MAVLGTIGTITTITERAAGFYVLNTKVLEYFLTDATHRGA
jgi:hypothetical protein